MANVFKGIIIFSFGALFTCLLIYGALFLQRGVGLSPINNIGIFNGNSECANLSLQETAYCLNKNLSSWWTYNTSNLYAFWPIKNIDWDVIKREGGVCWHATEWYNLKAESLGFSAKEITFGEDEGHSYSLIWDKTMTEYCILDQQIKPSCYRLGDKNE